MSPECAGRRQRRLDPRLEVPASSRPEFDCTIGAELAPKTAQKRGWVMVSVKEDWRSVGLSPSPLPTSFSANTSFSPREFVLLHFARTLLHIPLSTFVATVWATAYLAAIWKNAPLVCRFRP